MPRNLPLTLISAMDQPAAQLVTCWRLEATDGTTLGFTSHTEPLTIDLVDYSPSAGIAPTTIHARTGLSVDNLDIQAILDSEAITEADLFAGRWDYAAVEVFLVDVSAVDAGRAILQKGTIGEVKSADEQFVAEVRSLLQAAAQQIVVLTTPNCRVRALGDAQCGVDLTPFTKDAAIDTVTSRRAFTVSGDASGQADHYFRYGTIEFTSGANDGRRMEIKDSVGDLITLQEAMPFAVESGDEATLIAGCDRSRAMCRDKFNNITNYRGEPDLPGNDAQNKQASAA